MSLGDGASLPQRRLEQVIADYLRAVELGMPVDRAELLARHPDLAEHLRSFFAAHDETPETEAERATECDAPTIRSDASAIDNSTRRPGPSLASDEGCAAETLPPAGSDIRDLPTLNQPQGTKVGTWPGTGTPLSDGARRRFGDYELLAEIARGGMGVVYKARHVRLNRLVALKMILAGQLATPDDVHWPAT